MEGRDTRDEQELDDWFDEPDTWGALEERTARRARRSRQHRLPRRKDVEDWISAGSTASTAEPRPMQVFRGPRARLAAGLIVIVSLLGGLAAAGVFSSSHPQPKGSTAAAPTTTTAPQLSHTQPALAAPKATLKPGDHSTAVKLLQRALARLGYRPGTIDGQYGPSTTEAVTRFQRASRLTADGILGPNTLRALKKALAGSG